jgi:hypothetical protein
VLTDNVQLLPGSTPGPRAMATHNAHKFSYRELLIPEGRVEQKTVLATGKDLWQPGKTGTLSGRCGYA